MSRVRVALTSGLLLLALGIGVTLSHAPISVARASSNLEQNLGFTSRSISLCQSHELLPRGTTAIRLQLFAFTGPELKLTAFAGGHLVARGRRASGWTSRSVTIPLQSVPRTSSLVKLCLGWALKDSESVYVYGERTPESVAARIDGAPERGRIGVEYLRPGPSSWFSLAPAIARRMGLGRIPSGTWVVILVAVGMVGVLLLSCRLVLGELR